VIAEHLFYFLAILPSKGIKTFMIISSVTISDTFMQHLNTAADL